MSTHTCPNGHDSEAADYCDTCGAAIGTAGTAATETAAGAAATSGEASSVGTCPNCGTPRVGDEAFCEVCGLDFSTGELPKAPSAPTPATQSGASGWSIEITPDREWYDENEAESGRVVEFPDPPTSRSVELRGSSVTVGRKDEANGWYPDIDLSTGDDDVAVSRRHAEFRPVDDRWEIVDIGSTNGTRLNGEQLAADSGVTLKDGDVIHLGAFTRFAVAGPTDPPEGGEEGEGS